MFPRIFPYKKNTLELFLAIGNPICQKEGTMNVIIRHEAMHEDSFPGTSTSTAFPIIKNSLARIAGALGLCALLASANPLAAEDLATALAAGKVTVRILGTGGSSGDAIKLVVTKTAKADPGPLSLTVARGTRLESQNASAQNMVVAGVRGRTVGGDSYVPTSEIDVSDKGSTTYVLEGYCMNFEKDNPSSNTKFSITPPDPVLAAILNEAEKLSTTAKQAAVWIHTDHASYAHVNAKFSVSKADWAAAEAIVKKCEALAKPEPAATPKPDAPPKNSTKGTPRKKSP